MTARWLLSLCLLFYSGCFSSKMPMGMGDPAFGVEITWHGHSCFTLRDSLGRTLVLDPFDETVGYDLLSLRADALLITHPHFDHNYKRGVRARGRDLDLMESTGTVVVAGDVSVSGLASAHDAEGGAIHGDNRIFVFAMGGLKVVHLGDIGQKKLTPFQRSVLGTVDVLFVPVGGVTTVNPKEAKQLVDQIQPRVVFPMHHGDIRFFKLAEVQEFTDLFPADRVKKETVSTVQIRRADFTDQTHVITLVPTSRNY